MPEPKAVPEATPSTSRFGVRRPYGSTWNPLAGLAGDGSREALLEAVHALARTPVEELRSWLRWPLSDDLPADDGDVLQFFLDPPMPSYFSFGTAVEPAPLDVAIDAGRPDMVEALLSLKSVPGSDSEGTHRLRGADPNGAFFGIQRLYAASMRGDHRLVKLLLDAGADPDRANDLEIRAKIDEYWGVEDISERHHQSSALHAAARGGHLFVAEELLRRGAKVDPKRSDASTPLLEAASRGHRNAVRLLIAYGANPRAKSEGFDDWPLLERALCKDLGYLKELVQYGAEPRDDGARLLISAISLDDREILDWLFKEHGFADFMEEKFENVYSALGSAIHDGKINSAEYLRANGAKLDHSALAQADLRLAEACKYGGEFYQRSLAMKAKVDEWRAEAGAVSASEKRRRVDGKASGLLAAFALRGPERNAVEQSGEASGEHDVRALLHDARSHIVLTSDRATVEANLKRLSVEDRSVLVTGLEPVLGREVPLESLVRSLAASRGPVPEPFDVIHAVEGVDRQVVKAVLPDRAAQRIALALMDHLDTGKFELSREELDQLLIGHLPGPGGTTGSLRAAINLRRSLGGPSSSIAPDSAEAPGLPDQKDEKGERGEKGEKGEKASSGGSRRKADSEVSPVQPSLLERSDSARDFRR